MKLTRKQLLMAAGLVVSSTSVLADSLQPGFYAGLNTGASFVTNQESGADVFIENFSISEIVELTDQVSVTHREESSIRGINAGLFAGWNFYCDDRWFHGVEFSADFFSNRGRFTHDTAQVFHGNVEGSFLPVNAESLNYEEGYDLEYALNLTFRPGVKINDSTLLYGIIGASWASFENEVTRKISDDEFPIADIPDVDEEFLGQISDKRSQSESLWGFVLGFGLQKQLTHYMSVFSSYQYTYYGKCELDGFESSGIVGDSFDIEAVDADGAFETTITNRQVTLDSNIFKVGMVFNF